jgi:hypothetical protein
MIYFKKVLILSILGKLRSFRVNTHYMPNVDFLLSKIGAKKSHSCVPLRGVLLLLECWQRAPKMGPSKVYELSASLPIKVYPAENLLKKEKKVLEEI